MKPAARAGVGAAALTLLVITGTLGAVLWRAEGGAGLSPSDWAAIRFTLVQAALSAAISVALAIPVARALARRSFPGRGAIITLLGAPFILPVIVAVFGLLAVFGRNGLASQALVWAGLPPIQIYGLHGVVIAHVFLNLPLATRLLLQGWLAIPAERFRLAASLDLTTREINRLLEAPMLRATVPGALMVIFLICTTSFAVALTLGGGPRATTVELAIYQAFRFDFDLGKAALLGIVQVTITGAAALLALRFTVPSAMGGGLDRQHRRWDASAGWRRGLDTAWIAAAALFLILPMAMIAVDGVPRLLSLPETVWIAALRSIAVALTSAILAIALALPIALAVWELRARQGLSRSVEAIGYLSIAASPLVIGTGLFILLFPVADPFALALPVTASVNALMSLPFALRALVPAVADIEGQYGRLGDSLSLSGVARMRLLLLPRLRRPLGFAAGLAAALSMGDLGVIALFADPETATLPLQLYRLMAAYRMEDAASAALLLVILSLAIFWLFDRGGRVNADA